MTTLLVPAQNPGLSEAVLSGPRYSLLVSADREHREAAQRLRYRVFAAEPGFHLPAGMPAGLDADRFDEYCDHLLVRENHTGAVVGCYRMLPPEAARAAGGYYTATEFDLTALDPDGLRAVEMGRACVDPAHRSGSVLSLMWAGILHYLQLTGHNWVMGCVSVPMRTHPSDVPGANVRGVRDVLLARHSVEPARRVLPRTPVVVDGRPLDDIPSPGRPVLPPLLRGYLRLGARICGEPAHDPDFGVADFVALQSLAGANARYLERLRTAAESAEAAAGARA
ncbi:MULTISPECIES: GNAT family N-acyltransferase [Rhodococcus]|uniref:GNAT family N-acetyltransferase n=1 Tax=Rhodococcus aetherivorans TaxID=191292 RepID=A0AA46PSP7_9NOCA|nr:MULTISPECIES: GNAT family N-acyltransferase [Rhodococcus]AKE90565.1 phosphohistidine phosphatase [Rhodococcus aetherivorans]ANZ24692.1 phosphohistidine phosphatase [Rhodococcus sp. WB1]KDE12501.1 phosphohistidine phosphatase [Rhodococcus aetherivorans]QIX51073.1 GNAT family N-acetyltransferase [Rhodococcus sp. DMU1]QRI73825.1 GNAT family N-acetyltransferase [Rhodococcus aetherivorans]